MTRIADVMTVNIKMMASDETVELDIRRAPVSSGDRLVGVMSDRDITLRAVALGKVPDPPIEATRTAGGK